MIANANISMDDRQGGEPVSTAHACCCCCCRWCCTDAEQAKLEPELHLRAGRHGEWAPEPLKVNKAPGPSWGVTAVPPGMSEEEHPLMVEIMRSQNKR